MKVKLKEQRLNQYRAQIFTLEMDLVALRAVDKKSELIETTEVALDDLQKAFAAVEAM